MKPHDYSVTSASILKNEASFMGNINDIDNTWHVHVSLHAPNFVRLEESFMWSLKMF